MLGEDGADGDRDARSRSPASALAYVFYVAHRRACRRSLELAPRAALYRAAAATSTASTSSTTRSSSGRYVRARRVLLAGRRPARSSTASSTASAGVVGAQRPASGAAPRPATSSTTRSSFLGRRASCCSATTWCAESIEPMARCCSALIVFSPLVGRALLVLLLPREHGRRRSGAPRSSFSLVHVRCCRSALLARLRRRRRPASSSSSSARGSRLGHPVPARRRRGQPLPRAADDASSRRSSSSPRWATSHKRVKEYFVFMLLLETGHARRASSRSTCSSSTSSGR